MTPKILIAIFFFIQTTSQICYASAVVQKQQEKKRQIMLQQQAIMQRTMQQKTHELEQKQQEEQIAPQQSLSPTPAPAHTPEVFETEEITEVTPDQLLNSLKKSSTIWYQIVDFETKIQIVAYFIEEYKKKGTEIRKPPQYYVMMIDNMSLQNRGLLNNSFDRVLQFVAIMEYDFDNGQNPDALARKLLGEQAYQENRKRLGAPD